MRWLRHRADPHRRVLGILKAYTTRVGAGPFPTELTDSRGEWLRKTGGEYGTTTGRPRRTGWLDTVIARYATRVNGLTDYFVTKLDVLSGLEKVPVCVAYDVHGKRFDEIPITQTDFHHATPVYEYLDGWWEVISAAREFADLPKAAQAYVRAVEDMIGAPILATSAFGPRRDQTVQLAGVLSSSKTGPVSSPVPTARGAPGAPVTDERKPQPTVAVMILAEAAVGYARSDLQNADARSPDAALARYPVRDGGMVTLSDGSVGLTAGTLGTAWHRRPPPPCCLPTPGST